MNSNPTPIRNPSSTQLQFPQPLVLPSFLTLSGHQCQHSSSSSSEVSHKLSQPPCLWGPVRSEGLTWIPSCCVTLGNSLSLSGPQFASGSEEGWTHWMSPSPEEALSLVTWYRNNLFLCPDLQGSVLGLHFPKPNSSSLWPPAGLSRAKYWRSVRVLICVGSNKF